MAAKLPDGATIHLGTELGEEKTVTAASNAAEAVLTSNAHGLQNGDYIQLTSDWGKLNGRVFKVGSVTTNTFNLIGADTTNRDDYPAGSGVGKFRKVNRWQQITQVMTFTTQGGEQQYVDFGFLEEDFERKLPSTRSAMSIEMTVADDPNLPGYKAAKKASDLGGEYPMRIDLKSGSQVVSSGVISVASIPSLNKGEVMQTAISYSMAGLPNRYERS